MSTHYDILGLPRTATQEQIQAQYRALAKVVHPDMGGDAVTFAVLDESYDVLRDPVRRAAYDATLRQPIARPAGRPSGRPAGRPADPARGRPASGVSWGMKPSTPGERAMGERLAQQGMTSWHQTPERFARAFGKSVLPRVGLMALVVAISSASRSCQ